MATMLEKLILIREDVSYIDNMEMGICRVIVDCSDYDRNMVKYMFYSWPEYSGDDVYPVPADDCSAENAFDNAGEDSMWDRESSYGQARWRLVDHMIEKLSK